MMSTLPDATLPALAQVHQRLGELLSGQGDQAAAYAVPGLWLDPAGPATRRQVNPLRFFLDTIEAIAQQPAQPLVVGPAGGGWSQNAVAYNLFPRAAAAFDHDGDGRLALPLNRQGWRETGTFLKCIALLPWLRWLGINTVYLLPVTAVGKDGHKGNLGSPYAIRNPYRLDDNLGEPRLDLGVETEFKAFVEAAHHLGMRVVLEFVFRTAARDADWVAEHPEWFYWIDDRVPARQPGMSPADATLAYGAPIFSPEELAFIFAEANEGRFDRLPPPPAPHQAFFTPPPAPDQIEMIDGRWFGRLADGRIVRVPSAFSDWPGDMQPPWTDVTYLRLYDHPDFNYIAYNAVRLYDSRLARPEQAVLPLWQRIVGIIPHYQDTFDIDGVMIDMGHALPSALKAAMVAAARTIKPDFAFWDENFGSPLNSLAEGYNATLGSFPTSLHDQLSAAHFLAQMAQTGVPLPFFATPETHDTMRAAKRPGGLAYVRFAWAICAALPAMPVLHGGFELGATEPLNTGIGFSPAEQARYPASTLALFSAAAYPWENPAPAAAGHATHLAAWMRQVLLTRARLAPVIADLDPDTFAFGQLPANPVVFAILRSTRQHTPRLIVLANSDYFNPQAVELTLPGVPAVLVDQLDGAAYPLDAEQRLRLVLQPGQAVWFELA